MEHVLPSIKEMWPDRRERKNDIIIQQDGASSHVGIVDEEFRRHCTEGGALHCTVHTISVAIQSLYSITSIQYYSSTMAMYSIRIYR
jgi:hypothetical protein